MPRSIEMTELERKKLADAGRQSIACTHGWRPIETAPKDGRLFLAYYKKHGTHEHAVVNYQNDGRLIVWVGENFAPVESFAIEFNPTHWQPLPKPPQEDLK